MLNTTEIILKTVLCSCLLQCIVDDIWYLHSVKYWNLKCCIINGCTLMLDGDWSFQKSTYCDFLVETPAAGLLEMWNIYDCVESWSEMKSILPVTVCWSQTWRITRLSCPGFSCMWPLWLRTSWPWRASWTAPSWPWRRLWSVNHTLTRCAWQTDLR